MIARLLLVAAAATMLAGCGLRPLYSGGSRGAVATQLRSVEVAPIPGRAGYLIRGALVDQLGQGEGGEMR